MGSIIEVFPGRRDARRRMQSAFQMSQGFQFCGVIEGYLPEDLESCGHAALVVWLNPLYSPTEPPANVETERPRKCA